MSSLQPSSLALLTDLYELTMACGYWQAEAKRNEPPREAVFTLIFRSLPFHGGFAVACGLETVCQFLEEFRFRPDDLAYLASLRGADGGPLFESAFLDYLGRLELSVDIDAVPEGALVFPQEPLVRVSGPILQCQLLETALLTILNFQTLIATKAARVCLAAKGDPVIEFGLRRAQGIDGGISAARAAIVGGCESTSNVLAGKLFDVPVRGTHAHSWITAFDEERASFRAWARAMPNNCIFLVDTYDTLQGVRHAVEVGSGLRAAGHEMIGIRLDSGDLGALSIAARAILDEGGFPKAKIVASGDLDEYEIARLKAHGAKIDIWGVGTRLTTAYDQPALGGVYKLTAIRTRGGPWQYKLKLSEEVAKSTNPGLEQVRRFRGASGFVGDVIYDEPLGIPSPAVAVDLADENQRTTYAPHLTYDDVLVPAFRSGKRVYPHTPLTEVRSRTLAQLALLPEPHKLLKDPKRYPVGLESNLHALKVRLMDEVRRRQWGSG
ncbi:MAG: nicotinate phosphoribosyltransferase [Planctomycetia bacterium]|nr:nicotinate phosphoribosyltransferase [Planctomycetia bacterium]